MDAQATDRAHRIGQTKEVSVYRLITANTIEERVVKRARQKQNVQATVYSGGAFKADIFKQNDIVELLYSEEEMKKMEQDKKKLLLELNNNETIRKKKKKNIIGNINNIGKNGNNNYSDINFGGSSNNIFGVKNMKEKKNKKKIKKEKKIKDGDNNKIKENIGVDSSTSLISGNKGKKNTNKKNSIMGNGLSRNIFSVRNNSRNNNTNINGNDSSKNIKGKNNNNVIEII